MKPARAEVRSIVNAYAGAATCVLRERFVPECCLPGSRVAAMRAGMMIRKRLSAMIQTCRRSTKMAANAWWAAGVIRVARSEANRLSLRRRPHQFLHLRPEQRSR